MKNGCKSMAAVDGLYRSVRKVIEEGRKVVSIAANAVLVRQNWSIGKLIVEDEQKGRRKADYGKKTLEALSVWLSLEYGSGYTLTNLKYMRQFYLAFPICDALRDELGWTHYRILMREDDPIAREWYMNECDETDAVIARYSVLHDNKNMFAVKYSTVMPSDEILRREIETQKELYRLQMQSEAMPERKRPIRAKKKGGCK